MLGSSNNVLGSRNNVLGSSNNVLGSRIMCLDRELGVEHMTISLIFHVRELQLQRLYTVNMEITDDLTCSEFFALIF
jgi:hypothetical protein